MLRSRESRVEFPLFFQPDAMPAICEKSSRFRADELEASPSVSVIWISLQAFRVPVHEDQAPRDTSGPLKVLVLLGSLVKKKECLKESHFQEPRLQYWNLSKSSLHDSCASCLCFMCLVLFMGSRWCVALRPYARAQRAFCPWLRSRLVSGLREYCWSTRLT